MDRNEQNIQEVQTAQQQENMQQPVTQMPQQEPATTQESVTQMPQQQPAATQEAVTQMPQQQPVMQQPVAPQGMPYPPYKGAFTGAQPGQVYSVPPIPAQEKAKKEKKESKAYTAYYAQSPNRAPQAASAEMGNPALLPKKKRRGWKVAGAVAVMLACMLVGCIFGIGVAAPALLGMQLPDGMPDIWEEWENEISEPMIKEDAYAPNPDITEIGGSAPVITNTANPVPEIAAQLSESVVGINAYMVEDGEDVLYSRGTGFVIHETGYILTNFHVVAAGTEYTISLEGGDTGVEYDAQFVGGDATLDLAVLKVETTGMKPAALGSSANTRVGELAIAMGNPAGADANLTGSVTVGYVSYVDRQLTYNNTQQSFLQIDTAVNPGNSGGPLLNSRGEVMGVVTLKSLVSSYNEYGQAINSEGLGFAIPIDTAKEIALKIIQSGSIKRPGIGILFVEIDAQAAAQEQLPQGKQIQEFMHGSPAKAAGLKLGDIIIKCNGVLLSEQDTLVSTIQASQLGDIIELTVWRDGEVLEYTVVIGDMNHMVTY